MIKNCFLDDQPDFYKVVELDGEKIATIHALTRNDFAAIEKAAYRRRVINGEFEIDINEQALLVTRMFKSLTGQKDSGWELGDKDGKVRDITEKNISLLVKGKGKKVFFAINDAIDELLKQNTITEGISKN